MAAVYCYEEIPMRFLASFFDIQMRSLVYMTYLCLVPKQCTRDALLDFVKIVNTDFFRDAW